jgi:hypothetical protein
MEEVWIASSSENEREGMDVHLGVEGSKSNGQRKKLDKEGDSSRTGSHQTYEGRISRSDGRHHHHSQSRSKRMKNISSSPSPTRKHRISRVHELKGEMNKIKPPTLDGEHKKEEDDKTWLLGMRKYFQMQNYSSHAEGRVAMYQLKGKTSMWWDQLV